MAAQDGFAGGAQSGFQMGLSMFSVMQQKAYQDAVLQNADENQAMRQQELQLNQRKFIDETELTPRVHGHTRLTCSVLLRAVACAPTPSAATSPPAAHSPLRP